METQDKTLMDLATELLIAGRQDLSDRIIRSHAQALTAKRLRRYRNSNQFKPSAEPMAAEAPATYGGKK